MGGDTAPRNRKAPSGVKKGSGGGTAGGQVKGVSGMYTVYYTENGSPSVTRVGMISAPSEAIAHRIAELQFRNARIIGISELTPPENDTRFPGARFINGKFEPVSY